MNIFPSGNGPGLGKCLRQSNVVQAGAGWPKRQAAVVLTFHRPGWDAHLDPGSIPDGLAVEWIPSSRNSFVRIWRLL